MGERMDGESRAHALLRRAMRAVSPIVNPRRPPADDELRAAVAGTIIVITGASFGLGEATAVKLAAAGAHVLLVARSQGKLDEVAARIRGAGGTASVYGVDLADLDAVERLAQAILADHGRVDVIVNNAGKSIRRSIARSAGRFHDFERTMRVNYLGPVRLALALLPSMRARRRGHIVNISTVGAILPAAPRWAAYQASKGAFDIWLRSAAAEMRGDGVTATSIYMALVYTRMSAPTPMFRTLPGMEPDEAADLVTRAIVDRPTTMAPWWLAPAGVLGLVPRGALERAMSYVYQRTEDPTPGIASMAAQAVRGLIRTGVLAPVRPDRLVRMLDAVRRTGVTPATACAIAAARHPEQRAIVDDRGAITYGELDRRVAAIAAGLGREGVGPSSAVAIMCRNHRGFVEALLAATRLGADVLLLNTEFPGPQLADALAGHPVAAVVLDEEFAPAFDAAGHRGLRVLAWRDRAAGRTLDDLAAAGGAVGRPPRKSRITILTSGTTGRPKGAPRTPELRALIGPMATLLSTIELRAREPMLIGPPLFHGFGLSYLALGLFLGSTLVLRRKFEPEAVLAAIAEQRVTMIVGVPVMLKRILDAPAAVRQRHDTSSLRAAISAGAALPGDLALAFMDAFGDVVYNLYGSTETGFGAIASPADLRAAPGTVGRPPLGTSLAILDERGAPVPAGAVGRVFIGGDLVFDGYSGGGSKEMVDGRMSTGDVGHVDAEGRLFIDGRADDMIVSGGENVFPQEVEDVMSRHAAVAECAVVGVPDPEFGQRLRAFVVPRPGVDASADDLRTFLRGQVARYKVPRDIVFLDELPRNPVGKVLRTRLATAGS